MKNPLTIPAELFLLLALTVFATYRLAALFTLDDGPFDLFLTWRVFWGRLAARRYRSRLAMVTVKTMADLFHCPYCLGVWVALILTYLWFRNQPHWAVWWLAVAGGQAFLVDITRGRHDST